MLVARNPDLLFDFSWGEGEREMLLNTVFAYHSVKQVRLMKPISKKFEELAMIWPKMGQILGQDLRRNFRTVYHSLLSW